MGRRDTITPVPPEDIRIWRDKLAWHFDSFCADGSFEPDDLWDDIESMERQLWVVGDGKAAVLTCVKTDRLKTCIATHAAGKDMHEWLHMWAYLEAWARGIGCKCIQAIARPGWERFLDMKKTHVILEKRL